MKWYQVKARFERVQDDGKQKIVSEQYLVQAPSFGFAEKAIQQEVGPLASGEFDIVAVARKNYVEIITSKLGGDVCDRWYKCKVYFITLNEKNGKAKKTARFFLVNANTALTAHKLVDDFMQWSMLDYEVEQIEETKILEVFRCGGEKEGGEV